MPDGGGGGKQRTADALADLREAMTSENWVQGTYHQGSRACTVGLAESLGSAHEAALKELERDHGIVEQMNDFAADVDEVKGQIENTEARLRGTRSRRAVRDHAAGSSANMARVQEALRRSREEVAARRPQAAIEQGWGGLGTWTGFEAPDAAWGRPAGQLERAEASR